MIERCWIITFESFIYTTYVHFQVLWYFGDKIYSNDATPISTNNEPNGSKKTKSRIIITITIKIIKIITNHETVLFLFLKLSKCSICLFTIYIICQAFFAGSKTMNKYVLLVFFFLLNTSSITIQKCNIIQLSEYTTYTFYGAT